jgi:hypothetical protein
LAGDELGRHVRWRAHLYEGGGSRVRARVRGAACGVRPYGAACGVRMWCGVWACLCGNLREADSVLSELSREAEVAEEYVTLL